MSDHSFNPYVATNYGINEAIFINSMIFFTQFNFSQNKNYYEERYWSYGTPEFFSKYFPYFSPRLIRTILNSCIKQGLLLKGNFNKKGYDRTSWYCLSDKILNELDLDKTGHKPSTRLICQKTQMHLTKIVNGFDENRATIPVTKPVTKEDNKNTHKSVSDKSVSLTLEEIKEDNPHDIPDDLLLEWKKLRKKPITRRVLKAFNKELGLIEKEGINPIDAVNKMLDKQWSTVELRFFEQDIQFLKNKNKSPANQSSKTNTNYDDNDTSWRHLECL
jgi:hypothetical protein